MLPSIVTFWEPDIGQFRTGLLVKVGDKYAHLVVFEPTGLIHLRLPQEDDTGMVYHDKGTKAQVVEQYRALARRVGATQGVLGLLEEAERLAAAA